MHEEINSFFLSYCFVTIIKYGVKLGVGGVKNSSSHHEIVSTKQFWLSTYLETSKAYGSKRGAQPRCSPGFTCLSRF